MKTKLLLCENYFWCYAKHKIDTSMADQDRSFEIERAESTRINVNHFEFREIGIKLKRLKVCGPECTVRMTAESPGHSLVSCRVCDRFFHPQCTHLAQGSTRSSKFCHDCQVAFNEMRLLARRHREQEDKFAALRLEHEQLKQQLNSFVAGTLPSFSLPSSAESASNALVASPIQIKQEPLCFADVVGRRLNFPPILQPARAMASKRIEPRRIIQETVSLCSPTPSRTPSSSLMNAAETQPVSDVTPSRPWPSSTQERRMALDTLSHDEEMIANLNNDFIVPSSRSVSVQNVTRERDPSPVPSVNKVVTLIKRIFGGCKSMPASVCTDGVVQHDEYLYCDQCDVEYFGVCITHGPLRRMADSIVEPNDQGKAEHSLPVGLVVRKSSLLGAGVGVFADVDVDQGIMFGPYEGKVVAIDSIEALASEYCWEITKDKKPVHCIDGSDVANSNWMRFVNCASNDSVQNLKAFQYKGHVFYRSIKKIKKGSELFVWYGEAYSKLLGLDSEMVEGSLVSSLIVDGFSTSCSDVTIPPTPVGLPTVDSPVNGSLDGSLICKSIVANSPLALLASSSTVNTSFTNSTNDRLPIVNSSVDDFAVTNDLVNSNVSNRDATLSDLTDPQEDYSELLSCDACNVGGFKSIRHLRIHQESGHRIRKIYVCDECPLEFFVFVRLHDHQTDAGHKGYRERFGCVILQCRICLREFFQFRNLRQHQVASGHTGFDRKMVLPDGSLKDCGLPESTDERPSSVSGRFSKRALFKCAHCTLRFVSNVLLRRHILTKHRKGLQKSRRMLQRPTSKNVESRKGDQRLTSVSNRRTQLAVKRSSFKCDKCSAFFSSRGFLERHAKAKHSELKCKRCEKFFSSLGFLRRHEETKHPQFRCVQCDKCYSSAAFLKRHAVASHGALMCVVCKKRYKTIHFLHKHKTVHQVPFVPKKEPNEREGVPCEYCDAVLSNRGNYERHVNSLHSPNRKSSRSGRFRTTNSTRKKVNGEAASIDQRDIRQLLIDSGIVVKDDDKIFLSTVVRLQQLQTFQLTTPVSTAEETIDDRPCRKRPRIISGTEAASEPIDSSLLLSERPRRSTLSRNRPNCYRCNMRFDDPKQLTDHQLVIHHEKVTYTCLECKQTFDFYQEARDHQAEASHRGIDRTNVEAFPEPKPTRRGLRSHHEPDEFDAMDDHFETNAMSEEDFVVSTSIRTGPQSKYSKCFVCSKTFGLLRDLHTHQTENHIRWAIRTCLACKQEFRSQERLQDHQSQLSHVGTIVTLVLQEDGKPQLEDSPPSSSEVESIGTVDSAEDPARVENAVKPRMSKCPDCSRTFASFLGLLNHQTRLHLRRLLYTCFVCLQQFSGPDGRAEIDRHQSDMGHVGASVSIPGPDYSDSYVSSKSPEVGEAVSSNPITITGKRHRIRQRIKCPMCDVTFGRRDGWRNHQVKMHNMRLVYTCLECKETFYSVPEFSGHQNELTHFGKTTSLDGPHPPERVVVKILTKPGGRRLVVSTGLVSADLKRKADESRPRGGGKQIFTCLSCNWGFDDYLEFKAHQSVRRHCGMSSKLIQTEIDAAVDTITDFLEDHSQLVIDESASVAEPIAEPSHFQIDDSPSAEAQPAEPVVEENIDALMALCQEVGIAVDPAQAAAVDSVPVTIPEIGIAEHVVRCQPNDPQCTYTCSLCSALCSRFNSLKMHMQTHGCTLVYICLTCRQTFVSNRTLGKHMNVRGHNGYETAFVGGDGQSYSVSRLSPQRNSNVGFLTSKVDNQQLVADEGDIIIQPRRRGRPRTKHKILTRQVESKLSSTDNSPSKKLASSPKKNACHLCDKSFEKWERLRHHLLYTHDFVLINTSETPNSLCRDTDVTTVTSDVPVTNSDVVAKEDVVLEEQEAETPKVKMPYMCHLCGVGGESYDQMKTHLQSDHDVTVLYSGTVCKEQFDSYFELGEHQVEWNHSRQDDAVAVVKVSCNASSDPLIPQKYTLADNEHSADVEIGGGDHSDPATRKPISEDLNVVEKFNSHCPFSCEICGLASLKLDELQEHLQISHNIHGVCLCNECQQHFEGCDDLQYHQQESGHTGISMVQLMEADDQDWSTTQADQVDSLTLNTDDRPHTSDNELGDQEVSDDQCTKTPLLQDTADEVLTMSDKHSNETAEKSSSSEMPPVEKQPQLTCAVCSLSFDSTSHLQEHQFNWHGIPVPEDSVSVIIEVRGETNSPGFHKCKMCSLRCEDLSALRKHQFYMHRMRMVYECSDCFAKTGTEEELLEHLVEFEHKAGDAFLVSPDAMLPKGSLRSRLTLKGAEASSPPTFHHALTCDDAAPSSTTLEQTQLKPQEDNNLEDFGFAIASLAEFPEARLVKDDTAKDLIKPNDASLSNSVKFKNANGSELEKCEDNFDVTTTLEELNVGCPKETPKVATAPEVDTADPPPTVDGTFASGNECFDTVSGAKFNPTDTRVNSDEEPTVTDVNAPVVFSPDQSLPGADPASPDLGVMMLVDVSDEPNSILYNGDTWAIVHDHLYGQISAEQGSRSVVYVALDPSDIEDASTSMFQTTPEAMLYGTCNEKEQQSIRDTHDHHF